jgi:hypothetical protein
MMSLADANNTLSLDMKKILDSKQRLESENFLLKKQIERI